VDVASLGFMQVDSEGNVNPSILPERFTGPGGFPVIAAGSPRVYFSGGFTAGKREIKIEDGKLKIIEDGSIRKFVKNVYKILFSGKEALKSGKEVLYITERAVFRLTENGLELEEYAPGVNVVKDIMKKMEFEPKISINLKEMDKSIFEEKRMNIGAEIQQLLG
jgi:acyl CoA:acetate/3-ketoacid CoA transferase